MEEEEVEVELEEVLRAMVIGRLGVRVNCDTREKGVCERDMAPRGGRVICMIGLQGN